MEHSRVRLIVQAWMELHPGETKGVTIGLRRYDAEGPVRVVFENLPSGVEAESCELPEGVTRLRCRLFAAESAELIEDCEVKVVARGPAGLTDERPLHLAMRGRNGEIRAVERKGGEPTVPQGKRDEIRDAKRFMRDEPAA